MSETSKAYGPSEAALAHVREPWGNMGGAPCAERGARDCHDPALGLDRSVRMRDLLAAVCEVLRDGGHDHAADSIVRAFGGDDA